MRKDVKIGLGIGGVLLAVLIVYLLVPKTDDNALVDGGSANTSGVSGEGSDAAGTGPTPGGSPTPVTSANPAEQPREGAAPAPEQGAGPSVAQAEAEGQRDAGSPPPPQVDWDNVFATGIVPEEAKIGLVAPTTPLNSPADDIFADRSAGKPTGNDVINWNQPQANGNPPAAPARPAQPPANPGTTGSTNGGTRGGVKEHVVQQGENLSMIAAVAYGDAKHYREILKANPNLDERKLRPGTVIKMPDASTFAQPKAQQAVARQEASIDATSQYRVQQGDSLHKIALKLYGKAAKADALYEANKDKIGDDSSRLKLGMVLKLPEPPTAAQSSR